MRKHLQPEATVGLHVVCSHLTGVCVNVCAKKRVMYVDTCVRESCMHPSEGCVRECVC